MAAELPEGITQAELDRYATLDRGIKALSTEHAELNAKIKAAFVKKGTFVHGSVIIERTTASSFDKKAAEEAMPFESHPDQYKPVFDPTTLPADVKKQFTGQVERLSVKVASE